MLVEKRHKDYKIYYPEGERETEEICKNILDEKYEILEKYKDTERNFVAKIEVLGKIFVLKSPKAETVIPQRKIQTLWKKGEALNTLYNLEKYKNQGLDCFIVPRAVMVKRGLFIQSSYILMDYIEGEKLSTLKDIDEVMEIVKKIHEKGIYHGDLNTSNFIKTEDGIKAIDTQGKQEHLWNFKRSYDILTLKRDLLVLERKYQVEKNYPLNRYTPGYMAAYLIKEFKYIPLIEKIRGYKRDLRSRGWKV